MADPITGFGAAAGALQFADVTLRASREAYGFLAAVKNASRDVRDMRDGESSIFYIIYAERTAMQQTTTPRT